ncbi:uncharacterized protein PpBr36_09577 [Pyricularia pennisetigena]|uniref:uncharacterized protein n=1 Tax=Pyricularia pennisetigena TaxID=1578925 RepID=UPI00115107D9|nr:uncharacterized protein PpBr36_09577 [Pyricularia pennisetigena]TLS21718.1 hypothetical protein PpBr36_09577 [Pyricularia pennisetigena]
MGASGRPLQWRVPALKGTKAVDARLAISGVTTVTLSANRLSMIQHSGWNEKGRGGKGHVVMQPKDGNANAIPGKYCHVADHPCRPAPPGAATRTLPAALVAEPHRWTPTGTCTPGGPALR